MKTVVESFIIKQLLKSLINGRIFNKRMNTHPDTYCIKIGVQLWWGWRGSALRLRVACASHGAAVWRRSPSVETPTLRHFLNAASSPICSTQKQRAHLTMDSLSLVGMEGLSASPAGCLCFARRNRSAALPGAANRPQDALLIALRAPLNASQTKNHPVGWLLFGGDGGARTHDLFDVNEAL